MNVYGYVRVSKDEDNKKESIETQRKVVESFAGEQGYRITEVLADNNISGYSFDRPSLNRLKELIEAKKVDVLIVKDLSRIGRHNGKTLMFLEYLVDHNVRLVIKNDNYDSENDDDTIIGIKTWYNEMYLKDISKKIKTNMKQKQKEGLVIVPNYGYMKDPINPKNIIIDEKVVDTIKLLFKMYIDGYGCTKIAHYLNEQKIETPAVHKMKEFGFGWKPDWTYKDLWYATSVKRILRNDAYIGTLRCGVTKRLKMKGKKINTTKEEQFIHEDFFPAIISREDFILVKKLAKMRYNNNVRAKNEKIHRYAGILKCGDCGKGFVARKSTTITMGDRLTYVCATFHRYGSKFCDGHRVFESDLDEIIIGEVSKLLEKTESELENIDTIIEEMKSQRRDYEKTLVGLRSNIANQKEEIKQYARQLARGLIGEEMFEDLAKDAKNQLERLEKQYSDAEDKKDNDKYIKEEKIKSVDVLKRIITRNEFTNADVNLLIKRIVIKNSDEIGKYNRPRLNIEVEWNTQFR